MRRTSYRGCWAGTFSWAGTEMLKPWDFVNRLAVLGDGRGFAPKKADEDIDLDDIIIDD